MPRSASVEVGDAPEKGHGKARRAYTSPEKLVERPAEGNLNTMSDVLEFAVKSEWPRVKVSQGAVLTDMSFNSTEFTNKPVMGYRELIKIHKEEKEITKTVGGKEVKGE
jgi:long-chain acyl-CoA synthetase